MKTAQLKTLLLKVLPMLLFATVLVGADIMINGPDTANAVSDLVPVIPKDSQGVAHVGKADEVVALYHAFDPPVVDAIQQAEPENASVGLTSEQQQQQQGLLSALYIDHEMYRLSAIINQGRYIAIFTVTDTNNEQQPPRRVLLKNNDKLDQYQVVSLTSRRITLRHQQRELWLQLFTPGPAQLAENETMQP